MFPLCLSVSFSAVPKFRRRQKPTLARHNTCKRDQLFFRHHTFSSNSQNHCQTLCEVQMSARTHLLVNSQTWVGSSIKKRHFQAPITELRPSKDSASLWEGSRQPSQYLSNSTNFHKYWVGNAVYLELNLQAQAITNCTVKLFSELAYTWHLPAWLDMTFCQPLNKCHRHELSCSSWVTSQKTRHYLKPSVFAIKKIVSSTDPLTDTSPISNSKKSLESHNNYRLWTRRVIFTSSFWWSTISLQGLP